MGTQKVVRTYPSKWTNETAILRKALEEGYKVAHITPLPEGIIEYIIEKGEVDKVKCPLSIDISEISKERDKILEERNKYKDFYDKYRSEQDKDDWSV